MARESGTTDTPFRYNGRWGVMTEGTGLLCMQARFYSPLLKRFLSEDPAGLSGGLNLYAFAAGDPVNAMDPFGLGPVKTGSGSGISRFIVTGPELSSRSRYAQQYEQAKTAVIDKLPSAKADFNTFENSNTNMGLHIVQNDKITFNRIVDDYPVVTWNPSIAVRRADNAILYPAETLYHEVSHAVAWLRDREAYMLRVVDKNVPSAFGNAEEMRVIRGPEAELRKALGLPASTTHEQHPNPKKRIIEVSTPLLN